MLQEIKKHFSSRHRIGLWSVLCFLLIYLSASVAMSQSVLPSAAPQAPVKASQAGKKQIYIRKAINLDKREDSDAQILKDSVILYHDGAIMYCDSAYLYESTNSFDAFGRIEVIQGDTLFLYGNYMHYNGNNKLLEIRRNVRLENNKDMTLFTDSLNYDRVANLAYYFKGGTLVDTQNELTSFWGQYQPALKLATFRDNVILNNEKFVLKSEILLYNTDTKIATITRPATIVSDSGIIHTSNGWYNTTTEESVLLDRSTIVNKEGNRTLTGDSIHYNKSLGIGEVFGNMVMQDTLKKIILQGHYGYYNEVTDFALATDSAFCIEYSQKDTLYLHGDTLKLRTDSLDKNNREMEAYYNVRFYRKDVQGVCDSMLYSNKDSILYLYKDPVLWNERYQISGDTIIAYFNDSTIDRAHIKKYCFAIEDIDSVHYNQMKGRDMQVFFEDKEMRDVIVSGNAESLFFPVEKDGSMIGMNQTESSYLSLRFRNKKLERGKLWSDSKAKLTPLPDLTAEMKHLKDFYWYDYLRPLNKDDIFREIKKTSNESAPKKRADKFKTP